MGRNRVPALPAPAYPLHHSGFHTLLAPLKALLG